MNYRSTNDELVYYKNRILNFIINNSGEYAANEISAIFGFSKRRIQYFVKEFNNKKGYLIKSVKGKYYIKSYPKNFTIIKKDVDREAIKKCIIYGSIKIERGKNNCVISTRFVNNFINKEFTITKSPAYLQRLINEYESRGKKLHKEAISYSNKHAISLYDEFVLKYIQKALIKSKYIKFI
ncbi:MAG: hypothetical protein E6916_08535 [Clostridium cochlearium]|uniref:hypothetical protein n=1 Tax=Clostridium cochlearium TaxID=1494 RepID=UPI00280AE1C1|nr:hypothetical protein [Clostridium cochlearium]MDU1443547.1 hypothetical protein [Clostridium cochlearium]